jgi:large subunit ribosomal protein L3
MIGKKLGMTQIFNEQGQQIPVTVIEAETNPVLAVTDKAKAGHASIQLGYGEARLRRDSARASTPKGHRAPLSAVGHAKKAGSTRRRASFAACVSTNPAMPRSNPDIQRRRHRQGRRVRGG